MQGDSSIRKVEGARGSPRLMTRFSEDQQEEVVVVMILMMRMISIQEMMTIVGILIEGLLITLEGHLEEVILLEEVFHFQEEIHPLVTISVVAMIPGDI